MLRAVRKDLEALLTSRLSGASAATTVNNLFKVLLTEFPSSVSRNVNIFQLVMTVWILDIFLKLNFSSLIEDVDSSKEKTMNFFLLISVLAPCNIMALAFL